MTHNIAVIITILLFILAAWGFVRGVRLIEKLARKLVDKAKGISPEQRAEITEKALLAAEKAKYTKAEETKKAREQLLRRRKVIERKMRASSVGSLFEGWALIIWFIFVIFLFVQFSDYLDASERQMDAITQSIQNIHTR